MDAKSNYSIRGKAPAEYSRNVEADPDSKEFEFEQDNVGRVFAAMDQLMKTPTLVAGTLMPDACPTGDASIPVGGVAVAENAIHPGFHGSDICCSVMASNFGENVRPEDVLNVAQKLTHFGRGGRKRSTGIFKYLDPKLEEQIQSNSFFDKSDFKKAQLHLGTQGDGNHFLFVGRSENHGGVMLVTHHGSRAFGANLFEKGMALANQYRQSLSPETHEENAWIPANSDDGKRYWDALQIVRAWTKLNHQVIHRLIAEKLDLKTFTGGKLPDSTFWNEHNFVFRKPGKQDDCDLYYHAKGATPLEDSFLPDSNDGLRLVPLNMAEPVLVVKGQTSETNLGFAPHGAGRNLTRTRHKQIRRMTGKSDLDIFAEETQGIDVRFYSKGIDISELPSAYKNAQQVQQQISKFGLGEIEDRIQPFGCIMAGTIHTS